MDAANPLCRWFFAAGLAAAAGCQSCDRVPIPTIRGQIPEPVAPAAPVAPTTPTAPSASVIPAAATALAAPVSPAPTVGGSVVPASPYVPGSPVPGFPVAAGTAPTQPVNTAAYSALPNAARAARVADLLKDGVPQIKVVAYIGATNLVTDQEVVEAVRQRLNEFRDLPGSDRTAKERELYAAELRRIIERELILDDMYAKLKKQGRLSLADEIKDFAEKAADQTLRGIRKGYGLTSDEEFLSMLRAQGLTLPVIRRQIERQIMADEYVRSAIKEKGRQPLFADIRAYYEQHPDEFKSADRVKWLDIFISFNKHPTPQAALAHAEQVRAQAVPSKSGPAVEFVELVKQYDNGLAAGAGGVGVGSKRGEIQPPDVEPVVWSLRPGEVGGPIATPTGYHVVKVVEREYAGVRTFDVKVQNQVREKLLKQYREAEYQKLIEELWRKGGVRVIDLPQ